MSAFGRPSHTAYHTHNPSVDVDLSGPLSSMGGGVGALEKRAWRSPSASGGLKDVGEEISVRGMASGVRNVCICQDREEGRRNSALLNGQGGGEEAKESKRLCPIHRLPAA